MVAYLEDAVIVAVVLHAVLCQCAKPLSEVVVMCGCGRLCHARDGADDGGKHDGQPFAAVTR